MGVTVVLYRRSRLPTWQHQGAADGVGRHLRGRAGGVPIAENETFKLLYYAGVSYNDFSFPSAPTAKTGRRTILPDERGHVLPLNYALTSRSDADGNVTYNDNNESNLLWLTGRYCA
jgi:hypothetical protein